MTGAAPARRDMGELERYEAAADKKDALGQGRKVQKLRAVDHQIGTGEGDGPPDRPGGDEETARFVSLPVDFERVCPGEPRGTVQRLDAVALQALFHLVRHRIEKAALVRHQIGPVDRKPFGVNALAVHQPGCIDDLGAAPQDLFRVATAQGAGAAIGKCIDDGHAPARSTAFVRSRDPGHARADDDRVMGLTHISLRYRCSYPAQQLSLATSMSKVCAASFSPSTVVR